MSEAQDGEGFSLPIAIGVTGHRHLAPAHVASVEAAVVSILEDIRKKSRQSPLLILSSLAEGADRLVSRIAMDRFGAAMIAVLPQPAEVYRTSFESEESKAEFDVLLKRASHVVVPSPQDAGAAASAVPDEAGKRHREYARAGFWVALHAHVLIALWDGDKAQGVGGTAEVVQAKRSGHYPGLNDGDPLDCEEAGAVAHVVTARAGATAPEGVGTVKWTYTEAAEFRSVDPGVGYRRTLFAVGMINGLCRHDRRTLAAWSDQEVPLAKRDEMVADALPAVSYIAALRAAASHFARRYQKFTHWTVVCLALATLAAGILAFLGRWIGPTLSAVLSVTTLTVGYALWAYASKWAQWQRKHLDLRVLAEGGRVQLAWLSCGVRICVADHYHPTQAHAADWVRRAQRTAWLLDVVRQPQRGESGPQPEHDKVASAAAVWVRGQVRYFLGSQGVLKTYRRQGRVFAMVALACVVVGVIIGAGGKVLYFLPGAQSFVDEVLILKIGKVVLALTAAIKAYQAHMAFADLERSFGTSAHLFTVADEALHKVGDSGDQRRRLTDLLVALGRAALVENIGWAQLKRQRTLRPPLG